MSQSVSLQSPQGYLTPKDKHIYIRNNKGIYSEFSGGHGSIAQAANDFQVYIMARPLYEGSVKDSPALAALDARRLPLRTQGKIAAQIDDQTYAENQLTEKA